MDTSERQIKRIVLQRMDRCLVCHREYGTENVQVISRNPDMWMMVVECADCHARNFVAAVLNEGDPTQAELALRRLSESDVENVVSVAPAEPAIDRDPVSAGDVADMHRFLNAFDGDFNDLFRRVDS